MGVLSSALKELDRKIQRTSLNYRKDASLKGVRPDFLIRAPDGSEIVVDLRAWESTPSLLRRARDQVQRYTDSLGADKAYIVVEGLKNSRPREGLLAPQDAVEIIVEKTVAPKGRESTGARKIKKTKKDYPLIFAAMPFHKRYQDTFWFGMVPAAEAVQASCKRLDVNNFSGEILSTMKKWIRNSKAVIADLSGSNPNVLYEVGYAHALNKPTIHLCSTSLKKLPFDVKTWPTIRYEIGGVYRLKPKLVKQLKEILG